MVGGTPLSRRDFVRAGAAAAGGGVLVATLPERSSGSVQTAGLSASDVSVSSNDGTLNTLMIDPNLTVSWDGLGTAVSNVQVIITASGPSNSGTVYSNTTNSSTTAKSGDHTIQPGELNLLSGNDNGVLTSGNFEPESDGTSKSTDVTVTVEVNLKDSSSNTIASATESVTFTVTVSDTASSTSLSGSLNPSGSN